MTLVLTRPAPQADAPRPDPAPLLRPERIDFFGAPLDPLTMDAMLDLAEQAMRTRTPLTHVSLNVAKLVTMATDARLREDVRQGDVVTADGMGIVWGARLLGMPVPERVAGVDLMNALLALCAERGYRPFILGAEEEVLQRATRILSGRYPGLRFAGLRNGYFRQIEEEEVAQQIRDSGADCLFVAISSPKKERFMKAHGAAMGVPFVMGVGGAIDVAAGVVRRAPCWVQRCGMEWLYRLYQEPRRMWRRYLTTNARYMVWLLVALVARGKRRRMNNRLATGAGPVDSRQNLSQCRQIREKDP